MFEYHGWAVVRDDTCDGDDARLHRIVEELRRVIGQFGDGSGVADVRWVNGTCMVWFAGCPNHRHESVFGLFPWLAEQGPGSYGLLYVWDSEDDEYSNAFQVWCLRRGQVELRRDPFLSPCIPAVEDPYDPERG